MTGIVIYQSTYGSTKQYAEWIREETGFKLLESSSASISPDVDTVVIGSPMVAFRPTLAGWIVKHWGELAGKRVFLFTTSASDPDGQPVRAQVEKSLPDHVKQGVRVFPLYGRFDFDKLTSRDKVKIRIAAVFISWIRKQMHHPIDGVARQNLRDLLAAIKKSA